MSDGPFRRVEIDGRSALVCVPLEPIAPHFFTTRLWRLGSPHPNDGDAWRDVAAAARVPPGRLLRLHQVHGSAVVVHRGTEPIGEDTATTPPDADVLISDDPRVALAVQTADCIPLLIGDRRRGAAAAAHAGWRGLALAVPRILVEALTRECGSRPEDLVAAIGPSIAACCYEVGDEVRERFRDAFATASAERWFAAAPIADARNPPFRALGSGRAGKWFFDAWTAARDQLAGAGVPRDQIFAAGLCTASHPDLLCSYRRDGKDAGRMAAVIRASGRNLQGGR